MTRLKLKDPVDSAINESDATKLVSLEDLNPEALKGEVVKTNDPFATYPYKTLKTGNKVPVYDEDGRPMKKGGQPVLKDEVICLTHVLLYNHHVKQIKNDPANRGTKRVTTHNRCVYNPDTDENFDLVFDKPFKFKKGDYLGCIIPQNKLRAQVAFKYDTQTKRIITDERYMFLDVDQGKPLMRLFQMIITPNLKMEADADFISGSSDVDPGEASAE